MKHCKSCTCEQNPHELITDRQREVLALAVKGYAQKEIAVALKLEVGTVKAHMQRMFRAFKIQDGCKAVKLVRLCYEDPRILG